ncbi:hypothetical protein RCL1_000925 [Eukaryota sp. TZLM3-RCL]
MKLTVLLVLFLLYNIANSQKILYVKLSGSSTIGTIDSILSSQTLPYRKVTHISLGDVAGTSDFNVILISNSDIKTSLDPILPWLKEGKHIIVVGGSAHDDKNIWYQSLEHFFVTHLRRALFQDDWNWGVFNHKNPLVRGFPSEVKLPELRNSKSYITLADVDCFVALRSSSGFGHPVVFSKRFDSGLLTWIDVDMETFNKFDSKITQYFKQLLANAFTTTCACFDNLRPSTLVVLALMHHVRYPHDYSQFQKVLQSNLIDFDFVSTSPSLKLFESPSLDLYSHFIIFPQLMQYEDELVNGIEELLDHGKSVLMIGDFENNFQFGFRRRFIGLTHLDSSQSFDPNIHVFDPTHPLTLGMPPNVTFAKNMYMNSFPSGHDSVILMRNDVGLPVLTCTSRSDWHGGLFVHHSLKMTDAFIMSSDSLVYVEKLFANFFKVSRDASVCKPHYKPDLVVLGLKDLRRSVSVREYEQVLKGIQRILGGFALEESSPAFQLSIINKYNLEDDFERFSTILYLFDGEDSSLYAPEHISRVIERGVRVFMAGGNTREHWVRTMDEYLFKFDTNNITWSVAASPVVTIVDSQNPIVKGLSKQHAFLADSSALQFNVRSPVDVHVIAKYGDGQPFLFSKNIGGFVFYYCVAPFKSWKEYDLVFQMQLIANFYL